jgi:hypothetical protein
MSYSEINVLVLLVFVIVAIGLWLPNLFRHKLVTNIIVPLLLLFSWLGLVLFQSYKIESVFSLLTEEYSSKNLSNYKVSELYKGEKVSGKLYAEENYLGIIGVRFWNFWRLNDDNIIFRIRESGTNRWYYENRYKSDQFQPHQYFTFGFPTIENSQGKYYEFEVESEHGEPGNSVGISEINPTYIVKYKFPREVIFSSPESTLSFLFTKMKNLTKNSSFNAASYIFLLPLVLYFLTCIPFVSKFLDRKSNYLIPDRRIITIVALITGVVLDALFVKLGNMTMLLLLIMWIYTFKHFSLKLSLFFGLSLIMLLASGIVYYLKLDIASERSGAWAWGFLTLTVIMTIYKQKFVPQT